MLTNSQKKQLKALANTLDTKYQVGKNGITDTLIESLDKGLEAHELIKVSVLKSLDLPIMEIALDLSIKLHAEVVQVLGRSIILFRINKENNKIKLVK
ncbi:MAG: YhbY family RNA-binding protein [Bacilli bacterium]|nr:YhbY family RNA-binding protein [Bacilli bacterium]